jgi:hypothetical protein
VDLETNPQTDWSGVLPGLNVGFDLACLLVFASPGFAEDKQLVFFNRVQDSLESHSEVARSGTNVVKKHQPTEHASDCSWFQKIHCLFPLNIPVNVSASPVC